MTLIITGASGNFGRATVDALLDRLPPEDLVLVTRDPRKLAAYAERGCAVRRGDYDDPGSMADAFAGGTKMLLMSASKVGSRMPQHKRAIDAAVAAGVRHLVYTSYVGKDDGENPSLAVSDHRGTERLIKESGVRYTILRNSQYIDAVIEAQAPHALRTGKWMASAADGKMAQVTRQDCVDSAVAVLTTDGHEDFTYNITGPDLMSFREISAIVAEVAGCPIEYVVVDDEGMYGFFDSLGVPREAVPDQVVNAIPWSSDDMVSVERAVREGYLAVLTDDVERLTGHKPRSLRSFAEERAADLKAACGTA